MWRGIVVIGADPGLEHQDQRDRQLAHDQDWARKFLHDNWEETVSRWNRQSVFGGRAPTIPPLEKDFDRQTIAELFDKFSKGRQAYLPPRLRDCHAPPMLFLSGQEDAKYTDLGRTLEATIPTLTHKTIPDACHRVPWENPGSFIQCVTEFITRCG